MRCSVRARAAPATDQTYLHELVQRPSLPPLQSPLAQSLPVTHVLPVVRRQSEKLDSVCPGGHWHELVSGFHAWSAMVHTHWFAPTSVVLASDAHCSMGMGVGSGVGVWMGDGGGWVQ